MMFTIDDTAYAVSQIKKILFEEGDARARVVMNDGEIVRISEGEGRTLAGRPLQVLPALPGTYEIGWELGAKSAAEAYHWPVLGWAIFVDGSVSPVTAGGVGDDSSRLILHPCGRVENVGNTVYRTISDAFLSFQRKI